MEVDTVPTPEPPAVAESMPPDKVSPVPIEVVASRPVPFPVRRVLAWMLPQPVPPPVGNKMVAPNTGAANPRTTTRAMSVLLIFIVNN